MITSKELKYVANNAIQIPMPGEEYSKQVIENIKECYELYKNKFRKQEHYIMFSNGEEIILEIDDTSICHMLGIDFKTIKSESYKKYRKQVLNINTNTFNSYNLLEAILENSDKIIEQDNDINSEFKFINYYKSQIKTEIFRKIKFDNFEFAAINPKENDNTKQKIIFFESNEPLCPYFMIGIFTPAYNPYDIAQYYNIKTLQAPYRFVDIFKEQEIIIPTQLLISNNGKTIKREATPQEKLRILKTYRNIVKKCGIEEKIDITADYMKTLKNISK